MKALKVIGICAAVLIACILVFFSVRKAGFRRDAGDGANPRGTVYVSAGLRAVDFSRVKIDDKFWSPRLEKHAEVTRSFCLDQCEYETHRIENFKIAAGLAKGEFEGIYFDDSDVYKVIEGIAYSLVNYPDSALEARTDSIVDFICAAQRPDGYLDTYFIVKEPGKQFTDMTKHEMYCAGHMIEAAIAYYHATGKDKFLKTAERVADCFCNTFGPGKRVWVPGHEEIELALVKLYRETGALKYLKLSEWLLEQRGRGEGSWNIFDKGYFQDDVPVADRTEIGGHAVRAMYLFSGMTDVMAAEKELLGTPQYDSLIQHKDYEPALDSLWNDVTARKMYITGGIGSSGENEGFTEPYDLPNESAYCETCASVGMILWNSRMNLLKRDAKYADIVEKSLYNGTLAGLSLSGDRFFYVNPLASDGTHHRQPWFGCACCPGQISRFLPSIGGYIYATDDDNLYVNQFISSSTTVKVGAESESADVSMMTDYPWSGNVSLTVSPKKPVKFTIRIRIPGWCSKYVYTISGKGGRRAGKGKETSVGKVEDGYLTISRVWRSGDVLNILYDMPVLMAEADPHVKADEGKRAVTRGPLVYCLEECDNPDTASWYLDHDATFEEFFQPEALGGVVAITATNSSPSLGKSVASAGKLVFLPYYAWDNRRPGRMAVWLDLKEK
jgi:DUF1680 family protein